MATTCETESKKTENKIHIPRGKPKSGRVWKTERNRKSSRLNVKPLHTKWNKRQEARKEKHLIKFYEKKLLDESQKKKEEAKKRREENRKRKEENEKKAEVVQVIKNTAKIKRMKKKELKRLRKQ